MPRLEDCYRILGLTPNADDEAIRRAYKGLVLKYHPDRGEGSNPDRFRAVQEAYEALIDPQKRRKLQESEAGEKRAAGMRGERGRRGVEVYEVPADLDGLYADLFAWRQPRLRRNRGGLIEVILTPAEAQTGVKLPLDIPIARRCGECGGSGGYLFFICPACAGTGWQQASRRVTLTVPAGFAGSRLERLDPGDGPASDDYLKILVRVSYGES